MKSFQLILIVSFFSILFADTIPVQKSTLFIKPGISATARIPQAHSSRHWNKFATAGLFLEGPTAMGNLYWIGSAEAGRIREINYLAKVNVMNLRLGVKYQYQILKSCFSILPEICMVDMMISTQDITEALQNLHLFADVENEYGFSLGIEPRFTFKSFFAGIPIRAEKIFSKPKNFELLIFSINAGFTIPL
jgi:hypothetical protein